MEKRIADIQTRNARAERADTAGGVVIEDWQNQTGATASGYVRVTFAEKPAREILDALRAAGFIWAVGSWSGKCEDLPACVRELASVAA